MGNHLPTRLVTPSIIQPVAAAEAGCLVCGAAILVFHDKCVSGFHTLLIHYPYLVHT